MTYSDPEIQDDDTTEEESPKGLRRQLAQQGAELDQLRKELAARDRDLAFTRVGLPDTPMAEFFRANYQGDPSEEAIRTEAATLGLIGSPSAETNQQVDEIDRMSGTATGAEYLISQEREEEMHAKMRAVRPGPFHAQEIALIAREYGMPVADQD